MLLTPPIYSQICHSVTSLEKGSYSFKFLFYLTKNRSWKYNESVQQAVRIMNSSIQKDCAFLKKQLKLLNYNEVVIMARRISEEEKLAILAWVKSGNSMRQTAIKFKRSVGTIHNIVKSAEASEDQETILYLKEIEHSKRTSEKNFKEKIQGKLLDLMQDDTMMEIITKYKEIMLDGSVAAISGTKGGISHFVSAIDMISRNNINITTLEIRKLELEIKKTELELKVKGSEPTVPEDFDVEEVNKSFEDAVLEAMKTMTMGDAMNLVDPKSLEDLVEDTGDEYNV